MGGAVTVTQAGSGRLLRAHAAAVLPYVEAGQLEPWEALALVVAPTPAAAATLDAIARPCVAGRQSGTLTGYTNKRCRCADCYAAYTAWRKTRERAA